MEILTFSALTQTITFKRQKEHLRGWCSCQDGDPEPIVLRWLVRGRGKVCGEGGNAEVRGGRVT